MSETAVLEQPVPQEKIPFTMPVPQQASVVRYWLKGDRGNPPRLAYVLDVFPITSRVRLYVPTDQLAPIKTAMHVDDPDVIRKPFVSGGESGGTWDFSEEHVRRQTWENDVKQSVAAIAARLNDIEEVVLDSSPKRKKSE